MIIFIPLGGLGERFKKHNYQKPKALIPVFGKPILFYLLDNLQVNNSDWVYICYHPDYKQYRFEDLLRKQYPEYQFYFYCLQGNTRGAAETLSIALHYGMNFFKKDCPILSLDADNFFSTNIIQLWNGKNKIFTFEDEFSNGSCYSYVQLEENKLNDNMDNNNNNNMNSQNINNDMKNDNVNNNVNINKITKIIEKEKISNYACCGAYGFESYQEVLFYADKIIQEQKMQKKEFYISGIIQEMILENNFFQNEVISYSNWHCLGTPYQLLQFYNNYPCKNIYGESLIQKKRICFDLDNTLVSFPKVKNDYTTVEPIEKNIAFLKYLKTFGNTIIIYTARKMKTCSGNMGKVLQNVGKITLDTLDNFDIPYDEIYFGKPYADVYIDDLALNCFQDMEKEFGFYNHKINPRDFHNIQHFSSNVIKKEGVDLSGEIHYYLHIPCKIKDMFPLLLDYDKELNQWYSMEKISGVSISTLYTSMLLSDEMLLHVMNSLVRIQNSEILINNQNSYELYKNELYQNYSNKVKQRYSQYDYSTFPKSNEVYQKIINYLDNYEKNDDGKLSVIHGDPVMTNIMINEFGKIKFFDMRGKLGNKNCIYGDYLYDWAKLYQSLVGYDKILQDKEIDKDYEQNKITFFKNYFIEHFSEGEFTHMKYICVSLFFTLIPLHNNDKCHKYYQKLYELLES